MAIGKSKWVGRISALALPRPRLIDIPTLATANAEQQLVNSYGEASHQLADPSIHFVTRYEAVVEYSKQLSSYCELLATHAAIADLALLEDAVGLSDEERTSRIAKLLSEPATRSNGLAASLRFATYIAAMATALTAFAIKEPSRHSYEPASQALRTANQRLTEFESLERQAS
jgi:hypothetical protein